MHSLLHEAVASFGEAHQALDGVLVGSDRVRGRTRVRSAELGGDIVTLVELVGEIGAEAINVDHARQAKLADLIPPPGSGSWRISDPQRVQELTEAITDRRADGLFGRHRVLYKALYLFIRAYQDAVGGVLLELQPGGRAGNYSSMNRLIRRDATKQGPLSDLVDVNIPEYRAWLDAWRGDRNAIKLGTGLFSSGLDGLTIGFTEYRKDAIYVDMGKIKPGVHLPEALEVSAKLTRLAYREATQ